MPDLPTDAAGNVLDPVTGEPLGSLADLPGAVVTDAPAPMTGLTVAGTTFNLTREGWTFLGLGAAVLVGLLLMRED